MSGHTPGPWYAKPVHGEANRTSIILKDGRGGWVMVLQHNGEGVGARQQADADLVAAAPDLLEVARMAAASQAWDGSDPDDDRWSRFYAAARAAVAKATDLSQHTRKDL